MPESFSKPNRLANEKSPYLLQHAFNPVDWYPWGEEAFAKARGENKPIFLSIGYSTCHWCHVMEHESFENEQTAAIMNKHFVNIKVDREERPDVDKVYMSAVQVMTGSGGWPLSIFLTPDLKPFYGGTYFPPRDAYGRPGFPTVLERIHEVWQKDHDKIVESGDQLIAHLQRDEHAPGDDVGIDASLMKKTYHQIASQFDPQYAGFGSGPKFPRPVVLNFLFRYYSVTREAEAPSMSLSTLQSMANGGMYDQIGGGFHRYAVDAQWRVPHFEKMLYDQAQLASSYLDAYQITHEPFYARIARETLGYVLRDMTDDHGGFYSAEDADSKSPENSAELSEGAFYLWSKKEIEALLEQEEAKIFCRHFGVDDAGNALSDPQGEFRGKNILFVPVTLKQTADFFSLDEARVANILDEAKRKLFERRARRPRPLRDDKIITAWNGLMISAFARAAHILSDSRYGEAAVRAAAFVKEFLFDPSTKTLRRRFRDGEARFDGQLDDYAFMIQGAIDLYEATFEFSWLKFAIDLHGSQVALFWDSSEAGFFDFSGEDKTVLLRTKERYDGAEPSGNSIAAMNLVRLSQMTGDNALKKMAESTLRSFSGALQRSPHTMPQMVAVIQRYLDTPKQIVIAGNRHLPAVGQFLETIGGYFLPHTIKLSADTAQGQEFLAANLQFLSSMVPKEGQATVYVCENYACDLPVTETGQLRSLLERGIISVRQKTNEDSEPK
ncbi:MAG TPA: thioredoxin domain-containing protein [Bacteroidota bacterium]|nr:thioredoxin domain-containing protein [Bacteroidota bacterium]